MVRLEITIKEINSLDYKEITAIGTEISIQEIGRKATKNEKEVSNIYSCNWIIIFWRKYG